MALCSSKTSGIEVIRHSLNPGISMAAHAAVADSGNRVGPLAFLLTKSPFCSGVWQRFFYLKEGGPSCYPRSGNYNSVVDNEMKGEVCGVFSIILMFLVLAIISVFASYILKLCY